MMKQKKLRSSFLLIIASLPGAAWAADWGYDESKQPAELKASPAKSLHPKSAGNPFARTPAAKPASTSVNEPTEAIEGMSAGGAGSLMPLKATPAQTSIAPKPAVHAPAKAPVRATGKVPASVKTRAAASPGKSNGAVEDWIELFDLVSKEQVTAEQKTRFREALAHKLTTDRGAEVTQITAFWPEVRGRIKNSEDEKTAFASLFRALLRFVLKSKNLTEDDSTILNELLGPERISVPGDPPLTEDSVDAYGDMACFMYEQSHPGKSVDAIDNRTVFASVIARKYSEAPTEKDKRAMSNFSLSWAKFKVMWLAANEADRKQLYEQIAMGKPPASAVKDPLVTAIFANGPWR
jgi:hypothetical protein